MFENLAIKLTCFGQVIANLENNSDSYLKSFGCKIKGLERVFLMRMGTHDHYQKRLSHKSTSP